MRMRCMPTVMIYANSVENRHFKSRFFFSSRRRHTSYIGDWSSDCALPISGLPHPIDASRRSTLPIKGREDLGGVGAEEAAGGFGGDAFDLIGAEVHRQAHQAAELALRDDRSEERRVGKEGRSRGAGCT